MQLTIRQKQLFYVAGDAFAPSEAQEAALAPSEAQKELRLCRLTAQKEAFASF